MVDQNGDIQCCRRGSFFRDRNIFMKCRSVKIWVGIEGSFKLLRVDLSVFIKDMSINICDHVQLCVASIPLSGLQVAVVKL